MLHICLVVMFLSFVLLPQQCFADELTFKRVGGQGQMDFVVISGKLTKDAIALKAAAHDYADKHRKDWCKILIWTDAKKAVRRLPLSDAQLNNQYASYERNSATGLGRLRLMKNGEVVKEYSDH